MAPKSSKNSLSPKAPSFLSQTQTHRKIHPFYIKLKLQTQQAPRPPKPQNQSQNIESSFFSTIKPKTQQRSLLFAISQQLQPTTAVVTRTTTTSTYNSNQQESMKHRDKERREEAVSKGKASSEKESNSK